MRITKRNYDINKIETPNRIEYIRIFQQLAEIENAIEDGKLVNKKSILLEFVEKLKNQFEHCVGDYYSADDIDIKIDKTLEEFIGEKE